MPGRLSGCLEAWRVGGYFVAACAGVVRAPPPKRERRLNLQSATTLRVQHASHLQFQFQLHLWYLGLD